MEILQDYCKTGNVHTLSKINSEISNIMIAAVPYVLEKYPDKDNIYHIRAVQILNFFKFPFFF